MTVTLKGSRFWMHLWLHSSLVAQPQDRVSCDPLSGKDIELTGENAELTGDDVESSSDDVELTVDDTE